MIIVGYQGIGKSTAAGKNGVIDLESGNFFIENDFRDFPPGESHQSPVGGGSAYPLASDNCSFTRQIRAADLPPPTPPPSRGECARTRRFTRAWERMAGIRTHRNPHPIPSASREGKFGGALSSANEQGAANGVSAL